MRKDIDLDKLERDNMQQLMHLMIDDLRLFILHHENDTRMSERDIDDIKGMLVTLEDM